MNKNPIIHTRPNMRATTLYLTIEQHKEIKKESDERGITFSEMFRKIIDWHRENKNEKR